MFLGMIFELPSRAKVCSSMVTVILSNDNWCVKVYLQIFSCTLWILAIINISLGGDQWNLLYTVTKMMWCWSHSGENFTSMTGKAFQNLKNFTFQFNFKINCEVHCIVLQNNTHAIDCFFNIIYCLLVSFEPFKSYFSEQLSQSE